MLYTHISSYYVFHRLAELLVVGDAAFGLCRTLDLILLTSRLLTSRELSDEAMKESGPGARDTSHLAGYGYR